MASDPFDELLELENDFYKDGFDAGVADSEYAGLIEGKIFGVEKGYEKALEMGKLYGKALVWQQRLNTKGLMGSGTLPDGGQTAATSIPAGSQNVSRQIAYGLEPLSSNPRLTRNVESLLTLTDAQNLKKDNSDDSVAEFDDHIAKAVAKAKVLANSTGEATNAASKANAGIEDATGLSARH